MLEHPAEINLGKKLRLFAETISRELKPNVLTDYLYELAKAFSRSHDRELGVRIIDESPKRARMPRLRPCNLSARVLSLGLRLLGIETVERM